MVEGGGDGGEVGEEIGGGGGIEMEVAAGRGEVGPAVAAGVGFESLATPWAWARRLSDGSGLVSGDGEEGGGGGGTEMVEEMRGSSGIQCETHFLGGFKND